MSRLVKQLDKYPNVKFDYGEIEINDFDHIYAKMLVNGKQSVIRIDCPHDIFSNRYYLRGDVKLFMGERLVEDIYDYVNASIIFEPKPRMRRKLVNRYYDMLYF